MAPDFTSLNNLTHVGNFWMMDCNSLVNPDFTGVYHLKILYLEQQSS
jgi:hypothetical protein